MYQALYRKYRPSTFTEVVGQKIVVKTLSNSIINNKINHAYIFCGPRGTGKTSIAKIFAKTINCSKLNGTNPCNKCDSCLQINNNQSIDIIEIDAASNNGVDEIRELKNNVNLVPSTGKYKVYIIDEVHMLTTSAFNALLKTLEEPPKHVIFILATTEIHKIPQTVLSRCQKFDFKKLTNTEIQKQLIKVCESEKINFNDKALEKIAKISNGGMRDALSLLDQINAYANDKITEEEVDEINGNINIKQMFDIINKIVDNKFIEILEKFKEYDNNGKNLFIILDSIIEYLKNILIYMNDSNYFTDNNLIEQYEEIANKVDEEKLYRIIELIMDTIKNIKYDNNKLLQVELCFIKMNSILTKTTEKKDKKILQENKNIETYENIKKNEAAELEKKDINNKLKEIRINNTLSLFNKKDTVRFKQKINEIEKLLATSKYSSLVSLILDGELKAKGQQYMLFVYKTISLEQLFNNSIKLIEEIFDNVFNEKYRVIAENEKNWNKIKKEFNQALKENKKIYHFIDEQQEEFNLKEEKKETNEIEQTPIDNMFKEIVQYN